MRKLLISLLCLMSMAGVVLAGEVVLMKYDSDKKEVTVKEGDAEKPYKLTAKTKVFVVKDGKPEDSTVDTAIKILSNDRAKGKLKFEIAADKDNITELKLKPRKGK